MDNSAFIKALAERVKRGEISIEQIPEAIRADVQKAADIL